jgi:hypothetical protein
MAALLLSVKWKENVPRVQSHVGVSSQLKTPLEQTGNANNQRVNFLTPNKLKVISDSLLSCLLQNHIPLLSYDQVK